MKQSWVYFVHSLIKIRIQVIIAFFILAWSLFKSKKKNLTRSQHKKSSRFAREFERLGSAIRLSRIALSLILCSSHSFKFSSCNLILKLKSILLYCKCKLNVLKVTQFVYDFKWKRKFKLLNILSAARKTFSSRNKLSKFSSNLYVFRPLESEKTVFMKVSVYWFLIVLINIY